MKNHKDIDQGIANLLKNLRHKRGLSKLKMANLLYMDDKTWSRYEDGKTAPSVSEFIWMMHQLGEDCLKPVLDLVYPDTYAGMKIDDVKSLRNAAVHYFAHVASDKTIREWDFILFGQHGSSAEAQMQEYCSICHLPMEYRVLIARLIKSCYDIAKAKGELISTDHVMPDEDLFAYAIEKGHDAAIEGLESYSTVL